MLLYQRILIWIVVAWFGSGALLSVFHAGWVLARRKDYSFTVTGKWMAGLMLEDFLLGPIMYALFIIFWDFAPW